MLDKLKEPSPDIQIEKIITAAHKLDGQKAKESLKSLLGRTRNKFAILSILDALKETGGEDLFETMLPWINYKEWSTVRGAALSGIAKTNNPEVLDILVNALEDQCEDSHDSAIMKMQITHLLAEKFGSQAVPHLIPLLNDDMSVGIVAGRELEKLGWTPSEPGQRALMLIDKHRYDEAVKDGPQAIKFFIKLARDSYPFYAEVSVRSIEKILEKFSGELDTEDLKALSTLSGIVQRTDGEFIGGELEKFNTDVDTERVRVLALQELERRTS